MTGSPFSNGRLSVGSSLFVLGCVVAHAHDITTRVTWNREISRIVYARCAQCHHPDGRAFSLMSYQEASPWAAAIREDVLQYRMPPWGAVKGFGTFRNDESLTREELDLIEAWADGGAPEGNSGDLPARPEISPLPVVGHRPGELIATGEYTFQRPFKLDGFFVLNPPGGVGSAQLTVEFPDGRIEPLVWLYNFTAQNRHPFLLRAPLALPAGAVIRGLPAGSSLALIPVAPG